LYISLQDDRALSSLSDSFESVHWWFTLNGLSLNPDKYEAFVIGTGAQQRSEGSFDVIDLTDAYFQPLESVRSLDVVIDYMLSFDAHVNAVCKAANCDAKAARHIWNSVTTDVALMVSTVVGAQLYGTSKSTEHKFKVLKTLLHVYEAIRTHHTSTHSASLVQNSSSMNLYY